MSKLYTTGYGNSHSDFCMIVADLASAPITEETLTADQFKSTILSKNPNATLPALEVSGDLLFTSVAIVRYLTSFKPELAGVSPLEKGQVD